MQSKTYLTVRYAETDQMGIVHHSNYPIWFEMGRTEFLRKLGSSYSEIEKRGIMLPLYGLNCQFKSPAHYEDKLMVVASVKSLSPVKMSFYYEVYNTENDKLLATGETMHAWTNMQLKPVNAERIMPDIFAIMRGENGQKADIDL